MSFFDSIGKIGKATLGTALLPVDILRDAAGLFSFESEPTGEHTVKRVKKIASHLSKAIDSLDE